MSHAELRLGARGPVRGSASRADITSQEVRMEKRARGEIRVHERKDGQVTYSLRFRVNGKREILTLGTDTDGWTFRKADRKLEDVLARIRAGVWEPPKPPDRDADRTQTFHVFASRWWAARKGELRPRTRENYEWRLRKHLLPFFCDYAISEIDVALVERYREHKVIERERVAEAIAAGEPLRDRRGQRRVPLSNESINKTLVTLTQILDSAVERGLLESNPARGKRRRLKVVKPVRRQLEADDLKELLAVAGEMDRKPLPRSPDRSAADDRGDGEVRAARHRDVPAAVARRRRPPRAPGDRRGEDRRGQPPGRPESRRDGGAHGVARRAATGLTRRVRLPDRERPTA